MRNNANRMVGNFNVIFVILSLLVTIALVPARLETFNKPVNTMFSVIILINVIVFWFSNKKVFKSWLRYDTLFLIGYLIVHFQIPFLASIGIEPERANYIWINKMVVNYASWLSAIALLLWLLGYLMYMSKRQKKVKPRQNYKVESIKLNTALVILLVVFIALVGKSFLGGSYAGSDNWGAGSTYAFMLLRIVLYLKIIYFFINTKNTKFKRSNILNILFQNKLLPVVLLVYCSMFLLAGDRGPIMEVAILIVGGYAIYQRPVTFVQLISYVFVGAFIFTIISFGRTRDASERESDILTTGYENFQSSDDQFNPTGELASSNRILYRALDVVPVKHPYLYGSTIFTEIIGVVPFAGNFYLQLVDLPQMYISSSYFFTILGQGQFYTYGEGSEILGDIYINLGVFGVFIIMFAFGYFVSFLTWNAEFSKGHVVVLLYLLMIIGAIYVSRSNILDPLKLIVYALLIDKYLTKKIYQ